MAETTGPTESQDEEEKTVSPQDEETTLAINDPQTQIEIEQIQSIETSAESKEQPVYKAKKRELTSKCSLSYDKTTTMEMPIIEKKMQMVE